MPPSTYHRIPHEVFRLVGFEWSAQPHLLAIETSDPTPHRLLRLQRVQLPWRCQRAPHVLKDRSRSIPRRSRREHAPTRDLHAIQPLQSERTLREIFGVWLATTVPSRPHRIGDRATWTRANGRVT